ncbi:hypothetical protein [Micromonospora sp. NPDC005299]|uniref:hypothetical protein n=1 Tax=Micromonospora sp. NPDC005299 TaxID=3364231 RepID=UPI0036978D38
MTGDAPTDRVLAALLAMQRQSWEQGVTGHALLDLGLGDVSGEAGAVNGAACGEAVRHAATTDGDPRYAAALDAQLDWLVDREPRAADGPCSTCSTAARCGRTPAPGTSPEAQAFHLLGHAALRRAQAAVSPAG